MNIKRMRGRNHRPSGGGGGGGFRNQQNGIPLNRNHVFDSSGPEMRVRGTAQQLYDKYQQLARDASSSGDRVTGEAYYQHAEHYFRIISAINQAQGQPNQPAGGQPSGQERGSYQPQQGGGEARGEYQRRDNTGSDLSETQGETRPEQRQQEHRPQESRQQEHRPQEGRQQERRFEQRQYEPRPKPEFPRPERTDRPERSEQRFRPEPMVVDTRIDISSALEAELAAATGEPAGFGEQPVVQQASLALEPRAIPIIPDAPPPAEVAPKVPRPRGRPRLVKAVATTEE
jgi:hypothetical protein